MGVFEKLGAPRKAISRSVQASEREGKGWIGEVVWSTNHFGVESLIDRARVRRLRVHKKIHCFDILGLYVFIICLIIVFCIENHEKQVFYTNKLLICIN